MVPNGELPRHLQLYCDRYLTEKVVPGNRVTVVGIYSIKKGPAKPTSKVCGRVYADTALDDKTENFSSPFCCGVFEKMYSIFVCFLQVFFLSSFSLKTWVRIFRPIERYYVYVLTRTGG